MARPLVEIVLAWLVVLAVHELGHYLATVWITRRWDKGRFEINVGSPCIRFDTALKYKLSDALIFQGAGIVLGYSILVWTRAEAVAVLLYFLLCSKDFSECWDALFLIQKYGNIRTMDAYDRIFSEMKTLAEEP